MLKRSIFRQATQTLDAHILTDLTKHLLMAHASHLIKYNACEACVIPEMDKALQQCRHGISCRAGIHHQYYRQTQYAGYLISTSLVVVVAIEESHHSLHDTHVGIGTIVGKEFTDMFRCSHKRVEVDTRSAAHRLVELRVDVVGPALEGLHLVASLGVQCHQPSGNRRLAGAAHGGCYEE